MATNDPRMPNEGEGSRSGARAYNRDARRFVDSGAVDEAAAEARTALEANPEGHREAELAGKSRAAGEDPEITDPDRDEHRGTWERVKAAVRRDWEQTKRDLSGGARGRDLDQGAMDTLRQMFGTQPVPPEGEPTGVDLDIDWEGAEPATRFGYTEADKYPSDWNRDVEERLASDWKGTHPDLEWHAARPHVFIGWRYRRTQIRP
jgi:hypothetical protein